MRSVVLLPGNQQSAGVDGCSVRLVGLSVGSAGSATSGRILRGRSCFTRGRHQASPLRGSRLLSRATATVSLRLHFFPFNG